MGKSSSGSTDSTDSDSSSSPSSSSSLIAKASFEQFTTGIGSKLLRRMGYTGGAIQPGAIIEPIELKQRPKRSGIQYNKFEEKSLEELKKLENEPISLEASQSAKLKPKTFNHFPEASTYINNELKQLSLQYKQHMEMRNKQTACEIELKSKTADMEAKIQLYRSNYDQSMLLLKIFKQFRSCTEFNADVMRLLFKSMAFLPEDEKKDFCTTILNHTPLDSISDLVLLVQDFPKDPELDKSFQSFLRQYPLSYSTDELLIFFQHTRSKLDISLYTELLKKCFPQLLKISWTDSLVELWSNACQSKELDQHLLQQFMIDFPSVKIQLLESLLNSSNHDLNTQFIEDLFVNHLIDSTTIFFFKFSPNSKLDELLKFYHLFPTQLQAAIERIIWPQLYTELKEHITNTIDKQHLQSCYLHWKSYLDKLSLNRFFYTFLNALQLANTLSLSNHKITMPAHYNLMTLPKQQTLTLLQTVEHLLNEHQLGFDSIENNGYEVIYKINNQLFKLKDCIEIYIQDKWCPISIKDFIDLVTTN